VNILHIGLMVNGRREGLCKAFEDASDQYREFPISKELGQKLESLYSEGFRPDIIFQQIHDPEKGYNITRDISGVLNKWRDCGAFVINWNGDIRNQRAHWMQGHTVCTDLTCFANERDTQNFPGKTAFLQIGIDPITFKKWVVPHFHDVVFMGNNYGSQFPLGSLRRNLVSWMKSKGYAVYGNYPGSIRSLQAQPNDPFPMQSEESKIYSGSKIAISMSHYNVERYTSDRLLRCMGSHCMTLSHNYPGIGKDFFVGEYLDVFNNLNELEEKINYYLEHDLKRERIAKQGYSYIQENFTYKSMVENIIELAK